MEAVAGDDSSDDDSSDDSSDDSTGDESKPLVISPKQAFGKKAVSPPKTPISTQAEESKTRICWPNTPKAIQDPGEAGTHIKQTQN